MDRTKEMFGRALEEFGRRVRAIDAGGQWGLGTPCDSWAVRDIVNHVTWVQMGVSILLAGTSLGEGAIDPPGDILGEDPVATWAAAEQAAREAAGQADLGVLVTSGFGVMTVGEVLKMATADACVHAWDIARGTGGAEALDPELVRASLDSIRHGRVYGGKAPSEVWPAMFRPPVGGLPDADLQGQLLGLVGRDPRLFLAR